MLTEKSQNILFSYFTLFMNMLNECCSVKAMFSSTIGVIEMDSISLKEGLTANASLHSASGVITASQTKIRDAEQKLEALRSATVQAMSCLLAANIDSGLVHAISKFCLGLIFCIDFQDQNDL